MRIIVLTTLAIFLSSFFVYGVDTNDEGGPKKCIISGYIKDKSSGEDLIGATIYIKELQAGTVTNFYGFYSVSLPPGKYSIIYSYVGFESNVEIIEINKDITLNIELAPKQETLRTVIIEGTAIDENITKAEMSVIKMDIKTIKKIPAFMGEVDIIKAIQMLPGVQATSEGSTGFSVRGGTQDQNLILLDEATVYNSAHLMGFFSVFNNDAIKDVKLYKGDIPASAGGRLSSLLDIRMKDGNSKKFTGTGGIGLISSRLTLEGPIIKDKTSFIISGRRTYADIFLMFSGDEDLKDNKLYFYDLNIKVNHNINENNRIFLSGYYGNDILKSEFMKMEWGNKTVSLRWNHLFSKKLFSNITLLRSQFDYDLGVPEGEANSFRWDSKLIDYAVKADFNYYLNTSNSIKFGYSLTHHEFNPGDAIGLGEESMMSDYKVPKNLALEHGVYISNEQKIGPMITLKYGVRYSIFQNIGKGTIYNFDENHNTIDSTVYPKGEIFNTYSGLEPRVGVNYVLNEKSSIKASYSKTRQYVHLAANSNAGMPLDVWFPSSPNVKPQIADQFALGYFRNFKNHSIEASVEVYYKMMDNAIDFKDYAELLLNREIEGELRFGEAEAYGLELFVKMQLEKFSGWVSYTLSKSVRKMAEINNGKEYFSPYHKPHDISIVISYELSKRFLIAANWVYSTGAPVTFPTGRFEYGGKVVPVYSDRNSYKMTDYHRLDLSLTYKREKKPDKKWHSEWNLSIYNAYARKNAWTINFQQDDDDPSKTYAEKTYLFGILPSITYNFHF